MQDIQLQSHTMPALGFGTWQLRGKECADAVKEAIAIGYRHIDTAQIYENEEGVGEGIAKSGASRDQLFITTKVWREPFQQNKVRESVEESLRKLRTDYVDLLLIHWPFPECDIEKMTQDLCAMRDAGLTRLVGVSNFTRAQMDTAWKASDQTIVCNQVEYHPYLSQKPVLDFIRDKNMALTAYSPVARGKVAQDSTLKEIGLKYGKTPVQVTLRWLIQQDRVAAIPKAGKKEHMKSNFEIDDFKLTPEEMNAIYELAQPDGRLISPDWAPKWDKAA